MNYEIQKGTVLFALLSTGEDAFPDETLQKYQKTNRKIVNGASSVTFKNLPAGKYAVNILHDEDNDGKIKRTYSAQRRYWFFQL